MTFVMEKVERRYVDSIGFNEKTRPLWSAYFLTPLLGQGSFRIVVTNTFERRGAITNERTLPALDAAHILPFPEHEKHPIHNGLLLR